MLISSFRKPDHPARVALTLSLLVFLILSLVPPSLPAERWPVTPRTPEVLSADVSLLSSCTLEREKPTGGKFLKTTVMNLPPCACTRPEFLVKRDIARGRDNLRITALFVYTQTTSSRL